jgi:hypothetical protein
MPKPVESGTRLANSLRLQAQRWDDPNLVHYRIGCSSTCLLLPEEYIEAQEC